VVQAAPGQPLAVSLERAGVIIELTLVPEARTIAEGEVIGFVGVAAHANEVAYGPLEAIPRSVAETWDKSVLTLGLIRKMVTGQVSVKNLSSPIMIAKIAGDTARSGWRFYLGLLALLSISLGILNLLPIPILDGGHIMFCAAEIVMRKPVSERVQLIGTQIGLVMVTSLLVLAVYNDIMRLL
jgi:regulator of sigma E protease